MSTASLEAMLELWPMLRRDAKDRIRPRFAAPIGACPANVFPDGPL